MTDSECKNAILSDPEVRKHLQALIAEHEALARRNAEEPCAERLPEPSEEVSP